MADPDDQYILSLINHGKPKQPKFYCIPCGFGTGKRHTFQRHSRTFRHQHNVRISNAEENHLVEHQEVEVSHLDLDLEEFVPASQSSGPLFEEAYDFISIDADIDTTQTPSTCTDTNFDDQDDKNEWWPFSSKAHFYLCTLSASKTHHVSDETLKFIIHMMRACGTPSVPSFQEVNNVWTDLNIDNILQKCTDQYGNINWMLKPMELLKLQLANPATSKKIARYPTYGTINSTQAQTGAAKWMKEINFPWAQNGNTTFLKNMFVRIQHEGQDKLAHIQKFLDKTETDTLFADVIIYNKENDCDGNFFILKTNERVHIPLKECIPEDISATATSVKYSCDNMTLDIPQEEKEAMFQKPSLWTGVPIITVPVNIFMDDLSANKSRRWSPLHGIQMQIAGLHPEEKRKGSNTLFLSASDTVGMLDMMGPICENIEESKSIAVEAFDAKTMKEVILTSELSLLVTDFHMMSLACNHSGPSANKYCPKCMADKTDPLIKWESRTAAKTQRLLQRIDIGENKSLQKKTGVKNYCNPLWQYIDPHRDSPIGVLHLVYLGLAKHLIKFCYEALDGHKKDHLKVHLDSMDQRELNYKVTSNSMLQYLDSRQGKDFKHYVRAIKEFLIILHDS